MKATAWLVVVLGLVLLGGAASGVGAVEVQMTDPAAESVFAPFDSYTFKARISNLGDHEYDVYWTFDQGMQWIGHHVVKGPQDVLDVEQSWTFGQKGAFMAQVYVCEVNTANADSDGRPYWVIELSIESATRAHARDGSPDTRPQIGLGERVDCHAVSDPNVLGMGWVMPGWTVAGGGTIAPQGAGQVDALLTAPKSPAACTVKVTIGQVEATKTFTVVAPDNTVFSQPHDQGIGAAGQDWMGVYTIVRMGITPTSVSFAEVLFRENIPAQNKQWPDGTPWPDPARVVPYTCPDLPQQLYDHWADLYPGGEPVARLNGGGFLANTVLDHQYQDDGGAWHTYVANQSHFWQYRQPGQARASCDVESGWMGPFTGPVLLVPPDGQW